MSAQVGSAISDGLPGAAAAGQRHDSGARAASPEKRGGSGARLPDFFIVGHAKCGTTALHQMLREHPQIHMPLKEPRFFAPELRSRFRRLGPGRLPSTLADYLALFAPARPDQLTGEASPQYLRSQTAAERIARVAPDARIIAILREPTSFLRSFHLQALHNHNETEKDFAKALGLEAARRGGRRIPWFAQSPQALLYSDHVRYAEQLRRFHEMFPPERVLVLIYEDFRRDNAATVREVLRFLGVDDTVPIAAIQTDPLPAVRSRLLHELLLAVSVVRRKLHGRRARSGRSAITAPWGGGRSAWRRLLRHGAYVPQSAPDEPLMRELRRAFKPEVVAVSEYLERDLVSEWGYEDVE